MARAEQITCDVCHRVKGEANHWLFAVVFTDRRANATILFGPASVRPADAEADAGEAIEDICGEECAHKRLSAAITAIRKEETA